MQGLLRKQRKQLHLHQKQQHQRSSCSRLSSLLLASLLLLAASPLARAKDDKPTGEDKGAMRFNITIPKDAETADEEDAYYCTVLPLPAAPMKLVGVEPLARQEIVHHILLFGERKR